MNVYENAGGAPGYIGLTPAVPADLVAIDVGKEGGTVDTSRGSYLTSLGEVQPGMRLQICENPNMPCCLQQLKGAGSSFVGGMGTVEEKVLADGEVLVLDSSSMLVRRVARAERRRAPRRSARRARRARRRRRARDRRPSPARRPR